ncbi:unnamed protein product [Medioppia subpectinata]|uniref:Uncharacterized protein n=1 Tax=Medioppia subpectinata TaxID=1979941 RepID=A0A7R9Q601_9ACAR|nr:unnamed protein product [Medioppia subpectinata]CAG2114286.1 unnamed protein product [Medioppia subpectinata]
MKRMNNASRKSVAGKEGSSGQTTDLDVDKDAPDPHQMSGTIYRWVPRQLVLLIVISFMGVATIFLPYVRQLYQLYLCMFFYGFGVGAWNNSNNVWLIEMRQKRSPSVLLFSQGIYGVGTILGPLGIYGVGTILGPLVVKPYLSGLSASDMSSDDDVNDNSNSSDTAGAHMASQVSERLRTPFLITGCIKFIGPVIMLALFFIKPYKFTSLTAMEDEMAVTEADKARLEEERRVIPKKTLIVCTAIFFATGFMTENMYMDFGPLFFQFAQLKLSAQRAADIASTMAIALTVGRFLCIFVAVKVRPQYMIFGHVLIIWIGVIVEYFGQDYLWLLWSSAAIICYGYSCIYVTLYAFVNQYFEMTDAVGTIFIMCYNSLYLFLPYFIGDNIEQTPDIFIYLMFACVSISIVDFAFILFKVRNIPKHLIRL